jgi:hypothetical protein
MLFSTKWGKIEENFAAPIAFPHPQSKNSSYLVPTQSTAHAPQLFLYA